MSESEPLPRLQEAMGVVFKRLAKRVLFSTVSTVGGGQVFRGGSGRSKAEGKEAKN